ncbi:hypothetical protein DIE07_15820 [Burkholderia sp. Bp9002]|nr:hypothetical protein DIE07_15820 [Burkholderia sp. Bp9002]
MLDDSQHAARRYENVTDEEKITDEIDRNLANKKAAKEVLQIIQTLCAETEIAKDSMSLWLRILNTHVPKAQKWRTGKDLIEIYPSGPKVNDRMLLQVGEKKVAIVEAETAKKLYARKSSH